MNTGTQGSRYKFKISFGGTQLRKIFPQQWHFININFSMSIFDIHIFKEVWLIKYTKIHSLGKLKSPKAVSLHQKTAVHMQIISQGKSIPNQKCQ